MTLSDRLDHLPERKRREIQFAAQILFEEFEAAQKGRLSDKYKGGRIIKLVLFGSHARGDWVDDHKTGDHSDYDLLVVVETERFTDPHDFWERAEERLLRELTVTRRLRTQVSFIVHSIHDLNNQLAYGRPFSWISPETGSCSTRSRAFRSPRRSCYRRRRCMLRPSGISSIDFAMRMNFEPVQSSTAIAAISNMQPSCCTRPPKAFITAPCSC